MILSLITFAGHKAKMDITEFIKQKRWQHSIKTYISLKGLQDIDIIILWSKVDTTPRQLLKSSKANSRKFQNLEIFYFKSFLSGSALWVYGSSL